MLLGYVLVAEMGMILGVGFAWIELRHASEGEPPAVTIETLPAPPRAATAISTQDGRLIPMFSAFQQTAAPGFVHTQPRQQRAYPALPDGVTELAMTNWMAHVWHTRSHRDPVTFSVRGAARCTQFAAHWSREQVAEAKAWIADRGWVEITTDRGNYAITPEGEEAFWRIVDGGEALRVVAAESVAEPASPPRRVFIADD